MKKLLSLLLLVLLSTGAALAIPAINTPVVFTQKDGSKITLRVYGDEFCSYRTTTDGYQIFEKDGLYYYYQMGGLTKSSTELIRANDPTNRTAVERAFLSTRPSGRINAFDNNAMRTEYPLPALNADTFTRSASRKALPPKALVILVQFSDVKFTVSTTDIENMLAQQGYSKNGATGSALDYFSASSKGAYVPQFEITPIITLDKEAAFYGKKTETENDQHADLMVVEACQAAANYVNYADFSSDGKRVDGVYVIFAGHNQAEGASENTIWPHRWSLWRYQSTYIQGLQIWDYACGSELKGASGTTQAGIGTFCHEFGHVLGLPDFYDTDGDTGGLTVGLYNVSIMSGGNYNNGGNTPPYYSAVERWILGWNKLKPLAPTDQLTIKPIHEENDAWYINTKTSENEFYVIESRSNQLWDAPLNNSGMLIYHVDRTTNMADGIQAIERWSQNSINNNTAHPCMRLIESVGRTLTNQEQYHTSNYSKIFYPGSTTNRSFVESSYGSKDWKGNPIQMQLFDINNVNGTITLSVRGVINNDGIMGLMAFQREIRVDILTDAEADKFVVAHKQSNTILWTQTDVTKGTKSILIKNLTPGTTYDVQLYSVVGDVKTSIARNECKTLAQTSQHALIGGIKGSYRTGETINPKAVNLKESPARVEFEVDGVLITNGTYTFSKVGSQILKCTITYDSGDKEIITRKIKVQ